MHINLLDTVVGHSHYEIMRVLSLMPTGGAELGEVVQTAHRIKDGDFDQWIYEWCATGDHAAAAAENALCKEQVVAACQAFLRASTYYRTAVFMRPSMIPATSGFGNVAERVSIRRFN